MHKMLLPMLLVGWKRNVFNKIFMMLNKPSMPHIWREILLARFQISPDLYLTLLVFDHLQIKNMLLHREWKMQVAQCTAQMFSAETKNMQLM